ncbi:retrovirus-related pol polyprotein from transposon TNT 1-94 [Tanacetum coccineum]
MSPSHSTPLAQSTSSAERKHVTYSEVVKDKQWRSAMDSELEALEQNKTWTIEKLPSNKKSLGCKWVYKIKYKSDGPIKRFKARIMILDNHQVAGVDYSETFTPVAKMMTVQVFLAIAAAKQWELHQMDVHNTFLHGDLEEEVFMKLPHSLHKGQTEEACKLRNLKYFLGIEVTSAKDGKFLCHRKYALDIISEVGLLGAKTSKILMEQNHHLGLAQGRLVEYLEQYRRDSSISWKTKKQHTVSRSFAEAEYQSMALTTDQLHISRNLVFHEWTKHIEVDYHYIHDELVSDARHVHTKEQVEDFFTKALGKAQFDYLLCNEEEAKKKIYSVFTTTYTGFGCLISEELSYKVKGYIIFELFSANRSLHSIYVSVPLFMAIKALKLYIKRPVIISLLALGPDPNLLGQKYSDKYGIALPAVLWVLPDLYLDVPNKDYGRFTDRQQNTRPRPRPRYDKRCEIMQTIQREPVQGQGWAQPDAGQASSQNAG